MWSSAIYFFFFKYGVWAVLHCIVVLYCVAMYCDGPTECYVVLSYNIYIYIIFVLSCLVFFSCKVFLHVQKNTSVAICKQKYVPRCSCWCWTLVWLSLTFCCIRTGWGLTHTWLLLATRVQTLQRTRTMSNLSMKRYRIGLPKRYLAAGRDGQGCFFSKYTRSWG